MEIYRSTLGGGLEEAGSPHSLALASIDAGFAARAASIIFLSGARSTAAACAVVVASLFGAVGLRRRRCGNRSVERLVPRHYSAMDRSKRGQLRKYFRAQERAMLGATPPRRARLLFLGVMPAQNLIEDNGAERCGTYAAHCETAELEG